MLQLMGQSNKEKTYQKRRLKIDEVNILSSLYSQDGNNSAVTGGIGTEQLTDLSNQLEVKLSYPTSTDNKHLLNVGIGVDYYTSASSDNIDYNSIFKSSASYSDKRIYPSLSYAFENVEKEYTIGAGVYYSTEFDYNSIGFNAFYAKELNDKNTSYQVGFSTYLDKLSLILPFELRGDEKYVYPKKERNTFTLNQSFTQLLSPQTSMGLVLDVVFQQGFLSTPFNRVISSTQTIAEKLPSSRIKIPVAVRINHFFNPNNTLRTYYRFYADDWGVIANSVELEWVKSVHTALTVSPFVRVYHQTAANAFVPYKTYNDESSFATSDYDLSNFFSFMPGLALKLSPENGIIFPGFAAAELKYSFYHRSNLLQSHCITLALKFK